MSDDSDMNPGRKRKRKINRINDSSSSSDECNMHSRRRRPLMLKELSTDSDSDSDSSGSEIIPNKKRIPKVVSSGESDSTSDYDSESSLSNMVLYNGEKKLNNVQDYCNGNTSDAGNSSDTSNDQLEKCPICLASFRNQEIGSPESCDHSFCADCLQEWSKNVNTCPVDRQSFNLIYIKQHYNGKIIRQIPIDAPQEPTNEFDNPTFCEVCGQSNREDRMLLCDNCDMGYHLECLNPPLAEVPPGVWFCPVCEPEIQFDNPLVDIYNVRLLVEDAEALGWTRYQNTSSRIVPRTLQSERVRARIITQRRRIVGNQQNFDSPANDNARPSSSNVSNLVANSLTCSKKRKKRKRRRYRTKTVVTIDPETGQKIEIKSKIRVKRRKRRKAKKMLPLKTAKQRLAVKLHVCPSNKTGQMLPDVRIQTNNNTISYQRSQLAVPVLDMFGNHQQLDAFSEIESEGDDLAGVSTLRARRPTANDVTLFRRAARRKRLAIGNVHVQSTPVDILSSIMESQEKFHSKNSVLSLNNDGTVIAQNKKSQFVDQKEERINLNECFNKFKQTPMNPESQTSGGNSMKNLQEPNCVSKANNSENQSIVSTSSHNNVNLFEHEQSKNSDSYKASQNTITDSTKTMKKEKSYRDRSSSSSDSPNRSDSDLDIYSDIETVSTSRALELSGNTPPIPHNAINNDSSEDDDVNNSDVDLVIDTEKTEAASTEEISSTVDSTTLNKKPIEESGVHSTSDVQDAKHEENENEESGDDEKDSYTNEEEDDDSQDGCPNVSIYSSASIYMAKTTDINLPSETLQGETSLDDNKMAAKNEELNTKSFSCITDISNMTEDISEEERSYTPCLDEKEEKTKEGLEGLETEMISDEEKNDFDESHELKTVSDGDALEINAKESELDFSKPEDYEEGEIVDKLKKLDEKIVNKEKSNKEKDKYNKENDNHRSNQNERNNKNEHSKEEKKNKEKENKPPQKNIDTSSNRDSSSFKKLSKNNKERNYRDKDKSKDRSKSNEKNIEKEVRREKKKEYKHKEIVRYSVRSMIAEKPRKDKFGRDEARRRSMSRSSRSLTPRRSPSRRRSASRDNKTRRGRGRSRLRKSSSRSRSRSHSYDYRRSRSRNRKKKPRSVSKDKHKSRRKSRDKSKNKTKKNKSRSLQRSQSPSPRRKRDWERKHSRGWSPSPSRSYTPEVRHLTPSWTPPRILEKPQVKPHNLTVILTNDASKKKKEKKKKSEKKQRENVGEKQKKKKRERTPPPSKEVFASGDNILVSVSFNKDNTNEETNKRKRDSDELTTKRSRKEKEKRAVREKSPKLRKRRNKEFVATLKPVAIIDLDRSPFKEITPSPKDIIVLSDSENGGDSNEIHMLQKAICDSSQTEHSVNNNYPTGNNNYSMGPKTPPEPQIKFSLNAKQPPLRAITNPLHEPDDVDGEADTQETLDQRHNDVHHKGPNTPPEPPNSPPSSPDAYDPFDPTKSRSPTPETQNIPANSNQANESGSNMENRNDMQENQGSDMLKSPSGSTNLTDIQAPDSQSSIRIVNSPTDHKSPECPIGVVINQIVQSQASIFPSNVQTSSLITTTQANTSRVNILNSTVLPANVVSSVPQRIVLPNVITKSSPIKVSPTKPSIKSTPIKSMPAAKNIVKNSRKINNRSQNGAESSEMMDFDSPYSPGSSDYEDLFEPPVEVLKPCKQSTPMQPQKNPKGAIKMQSTFDSLFGSSPTYNAMKKKSASKSPVKKSNLNKGSSKQIGVKLDEDNLKILDDLPNSAVEMQVKDKFLKKLNRQERVVEEVKLVLKPHYNKKRINKEEYKDILRRAVPKICHSKSGEINPKKIQNLIEAYVKKLRHSKKVTSSSSSINPQKS